MSDKKISKALSCLEIRAREFKSLDDLIDSKHYEIRAHNSAIEGLEFDLIELNHDRDCMRTRISELIRAALSEGYSEQRVCNFIKYDLKLKRIIPYLDEDVRDMFIK